MKSGSCVFFMQFEHFSSLDLKLSALVGRCRTSAGCWAVLKRHVRVDALLAEVEESFCHSKLGMREVYRPLLLRSEGKSNHLWGVD